MWLIGLVKSDWIDRAHAPSVPTSNLDQYNEMSTSQYYKI